MANHTKNTLKSGKVLKALLDIMNQSSSLLSTKPKLIDNVTVKTQKIISNVKNVLSRKHIYFFQVINK